MTTLGPVPVATQEQFQFVVSARDADGKPLTDLKTDEVVMTENGKPNQIVKIEPFHLPVKLTIAVDNGILSRDGLAHHRNGLEVLVSTTAPQSTSYQATEIDAALQFLEQRKTRVYVTMAMKSVGANGTEGDQPFIAIPLAKGTHGRYEALSDTARLATLLPEYGSEIAALHQQRNNQLLVTAARQTAGPLQEPRIELTRHNLTGEVSIDGFPSN